MCPFEGVGGRNWIKYGLHKYQMTQMGLLIWFSVQERGQSVTKKLRRHLWTVPVEDIQRHQCNYVVESV